MSAKIKLGMLLSDIRGSISGSTYQKNGSGLIVRKKPVVNNTVTPKTDTVKMLRRKFVDRFRFLSSDVKSLWYSFAGLHNITDRFGKSKKISAQNWYSSVNVVRNLLNVSLLDNPPVYILPDSPLEFDGSLLNNQLEITNPFPVDNADTAMLIYTSPYMTRLPTAWWSRFRFTLLFTDPDLTHIDLTNAWFDAHRRKLDTNERADKWNIGICVQTVKISTGLRSPLLCVNLTAQKDIPMKRYLAALSQSGTNAPVPNEIVNSLGTVAWSRLLEGVYEIIVPASIVKGKVSYFISSARNVDGGNPVLMQVSVLFQDEFSLIIGTSKLDTGTGNVVFADDVLTFDDYFIDIQFFE